MNKVMKACFASVVSELQQSDIFMTVKARLFETPKANLNGVRISSAFLNEIVENEEKYVGLPLVADVKALANGRYDHLGHLYDAKTGQFHTAQIGSFYKFEKEDFDGGSYLVGFARIAKRNKALCHAIAELFADGALKFSFEISCGDCQELEDGTTLIDASESNFFEGEAIVSFPACEDAVALELVAECDKIADDLRKGENEMTDVNESAEIVAEEATEEAQAEKPEEEVSCNKKKNAEEENEETVNAEKQDETATVYVTERHEERDIVDAYDDQTGVSVTEVFDHETIVNTREEGVAIVAEGEDETPTDSETDSHLNETVTAEDDAPEEDTSDPAEGVVTEDEPKKKTAEELIAELAEEISTLKNEIAELKAAPKAVFAEAQDRVVNPFVAEINTKPKYSLLETAERSDTAYSLLEKA